MGAYERSEVLYVYILVSKIVKSKIFASPHLIVLIIGFRITLANTVYLDCKYRNYFHKMVF